MMSSGPVVGHVTYDITSDFSKANISFKLTILEKYVSCCCNTKWPTESNANQRIIEFKYLLPIKIPRDMSDHKGITTL